MEPWKVKKWNSEKREYEFIQSVDKYAKNLNNFEAQGVKLIVVDEVSMVTEEQSEQLVRLTKNKSEGRGKYIHYAIIHNGKNKYSEGYNHNRSTYRGDLHCSFHAEMDAVSKLMSKLFGGGRKPCLLWDSTENKKVDNYNC